MPEMLVSDGSETAAKPTSADTADMFDVLKKRELMFVMFVSAAGAALNVGTTLPPSVFSSAVTIGAAVGNVTVPVYCEPITSSKRALIRVCG